MNEEYQKRLRSKAEAILKNEGVKQTQAFSKNWDKLMEELNIYQIELEQQNSELQDLQQLTEKQKNEYTDLFDNAPVAYFIIDSKHTVDKVNKQGCHLLKIENNDLIINKKLNKFIHPADQDIFYFQLKKIRSSGKGNTFEIKIVNAEKEEIPVNVSAKPHGNTSEKLIITLTDISIQKEAESTLESSKEQIETVLNSIEDQIYISDPQTRETLFANQPIIERFSDIDNTVCHKAIFNLEDKCPFCRIDEIENASPNDIFRQEIFNENDGRWYQVTEKKINWKGNKNAVIHTLSDITNIKENQKKVLENEEMLSKITQSAKDGIIMIDADGKIKFWNPEASNIFGYTEEEALGRDAHKLLSPERYWEKAYSGLAGFSKNGSGPVINETTEIPGKTKDGKEIMLELSVSAVKIKDKWNAIGIVRDVTKRKEEQKKLQASEERYSKLISGIGEGIAISSEDEVFIYCNKMAEEIFEVEPETLVGRSLKEFASPDQFKAFQEKTNYRKQNKHSKYEAEIISGKGNIKTIRVIASPHYEDGVFQGTFAAFTDITKQKEAEKALIENEKRFRTIVNNVKEALYVHDLEGNFIDCNEEHQKLTGYTFEELQKLAPRELLADKERKTMEMRLNELKQKEHLLFESKIKTKKGQIVPVEVSANIINYKNKKAILISGRDMTERLQQKKKLKESEARFRTMADNIPDAIYIHTLDGTILDTNNKALQMLGYSRDELLTKTPLDLSANYFSKDEYNQITEALKQNKVYIFEDAHITKDNKKIPVEVTITIIQYFGEPAIFSVVHNISERKQAEKEQSKLIDQLNYLSKSATKFISFQNNEDIYRYLGKSLSEVLYDSLIVVSEYVNDEFKLVDFFGADDETINLFETITGVSLSEKKFVPTDERLALYKTGHLEKIGELETFFENYYNTNKIKEFDKKHPIKEACIIGVNHKDKLLAGIALLLTKPLSTIDIEFTQALIYQASIALQRKMHENELIVAKTQAEIANKSKSSFLTNISHEIRTPLNTIMGFTEILRNSIEDEQKKSYLSSIASSGKSLLTIINDILDLSKIESGTMTIQHIPISVKTLLSDMEFLLQNEATNKGLDFRIIIDDKMPALIKLDQGRLRQILHNLISNAIKFTKKGYVELRAETKNMKKESTDILFYVTDTGIGISEEKIQQVLEPFQQGDTRDARKYEGTGMGLSIAKKLTEMLNGELHIKSQINKGSTFIVHLKNIKIPATKPDDTQIETKNLRFNKERILLVEEDENQMEIIQSLITKNNLMAFVAKTGEQAFAFTHEFEPELIIINLTTQTQNSIGTAKAIRSVEKFAKTPIIGITNQQSTDFEKSEKAQFFSEIIHPPFTEEQLLKLIVKYIECKTPLPTTKETKALKYDFSGIRKETLDEIIGKLEEKVSPEWELLQKRQPLNKVKKYKNTIKSIAEEYEIAELEKYSEEIDKSLSAFDIIQMRQLLKDYPQILHALKTSKNKLK